MTSGLDLRLEYLFDQDFEKLRCDSMEGWLAVYVVENGDPFALFESVCAPDRSSKLASRRIGRVARNLPGLGRLKQLHAVLDAGKKLEPAP
jgi:hypothetical protein